MLLKVPYGQKFLQIEIPEDRLEVATSQPVETLQDVNKSVKLSLEHPLNSQPLRFLLGKGKTICVIIPDETRSCPTKKILSSLLREFKACKPKNIEIVIGNGLHRGMSKKEQRVILGKEIVGKYNITNHSATDDGQLIDLEQKTSYGTPVILNKIAWQSDLIVGVGLVEPHFFAGFSGGRKSILPAIAGKTAILHNHSYDMINHPFATYGQMKGNPIHNDMIEFMNCSNLHFIINLSINNKSETTKIFSGNPHNAHHHAVHFVNTYSRVKLHSAPEIVIISNGGYPLDRDLYQSVKGIATASKVVKNQGVIIIVTKCRDGLGGHTEFMNLLQTATTPREVLKEIEGKEPLVDQWQAQILAKIMKKVNVIVVTDGVKRSVLEKMMMRQVNTIEEALEIARGMLATNKPRILVIPEGPYIMPYL
jgi:nickel-dependent lactate racemase